MEARELGLAGVYEITPRKFGDARGFFSESFSQPRLEALGLPGQWVQDNHSYSAPPLVLRGLHYQTPPMAQDKLVRVTRGAIFDVVVDIRQGSPDFAKWIGLEISAASWNQIFVPRGFAHGFLTLKPDTEVIYKVTAPYAPECDRCILWSDSDIAVDWPLGGQTPVLSGKDSAAPLLRDVQPVFAFAGAAR
jgi:dTDP-4-dehydrorhamnose 3,5-epimerase